jgi:hypothetical protein
MKSFPWITLAGCLLLASISVDAQISIDGYHVYYGHLHNHTSYSDGQGTPAQAYAAARANGLDFFGLAEHSNLLTTAEWADTQIEADASYVPGVFTTFRGFEWTTSRFGHVAVINTPSFILTSDPNYGTFTELVAWLNTQASDCFAFFNHPGDYNAAGTEFDHFANDRVTDKIVGMEQWNKTNGFPAYYASLSGVMTNGYFSDDGVSFYDEALQRGWHIAPGGSEDNHVGTWGSLTTYKTAVLANANTREDLIAAFKARRFFTTEDLNAAMSFKINGNEMGSTILPGTYTLKIQLSDGNSETYSKVELMKNGVVTATWTPGITDVNISKQISCSDGEYYYIRVYQSGSLAAFSAPIWISKGVTYIFPSVEKKQSYPAKLPVEYYNPVKKTTTMPGTRTAILQVISPAEGELNCYPVPFTGKLNINFVPAGNELLQYVAIYKVSGTLMKRINNPHNKLSVSLENLVPGVYLVSTQTDRNRYVKTVVKQ